MPKEDNYKSPDIAAAYVRHRPHYPQPVYDIILSYLNSGRSAGMEKYKTALDVGCGPGMSTFPLSPHFDSVIGLDVSEAQIEEARKQCGKEIRQNVVFRVGDCHDLSFLEDDSVDLITVGEALHWFDVEKFCEEGRRVLRPGGVLAPYGYGYGKFTRRDGAKFATVTERLIEIIETYGEHECLHFKNSYRDLFQIFQRTFPGAERDDSLHIERTYNVEGFCGLVKSIDMYHTMKVARPNEPDPLDAMVAEVYCSYDNQPPDDAVRMSCDVFILLGRKSTPSGA
jgi:SAM-dependent methyltransferase